MSPRAEGSAAEWTLQPTPAAASEARRKVQTLLAEWGISEDVVDLVVLIVYELLSNAVDHAGTVMTLQVSLSAGVITVGVTDSCDLPPLLQPHDPLAARGRGLQMVDALATRWSCVSPTDEPGKTVWAEIRCPAAFQ